MLLYGLAPGEIAAYHVNVDNGPAISIPVAHDATGLTVYAVPLPAGLPVRNIDLVDVDGTIVHTFRPPPFLTPAVGTYAELDHALQPPAHRRRRRVRFDDPTHQSLNDRAEPGHAGVKVLECSARGPLVNGQLDKPTRSVRAMMSHADSGGPGSTGVQSRGPPWADRHQNQSGADDQQHRRHGRRQPRRRRRSPAGPTPDSTTNDTATVPDSGPVRRTECAPKPSSASTVNTYVTVPAASAVAVPNERGVEKSVAVTGSPGSNPKPFTVKTWPTTAVLSSMVARIPPFVGTVVVGAVVGATAVDGTR